MRRLGRFMLVLFFVAFTLAGPDAALGHQAGPGYVVLGDSIEFGLQASTPENAYVPMFHAYLEASFFATEADLHNFAVPGATVRDINHDQLFPALDAVQTHSPVVVSWGGGGNDLLNFIASPEAATCARGNPSCLGRLNALLNEVEQSINLTLGALRAVAGPTAKILVRTQYNPLWKDACGGLADPQAQLAHLVLEGEAPLLARGLNDRIHDVAQKHGAKVADIYLAFFVGRNTLIDDDCIHPNDAGYAVIRDAFILAFDP